MYNKNQLYVTYVVKFLVACAFPRKRRVSIYVSRHKLPSNIIRIYLYVVIQYAITTPRVQTRRVHSLVLRIYIKINNIINYSHVASTDILAKIKTFFSVVAITIICRQMYKHCSAVL